MRSTICASCRMTGSRCGCIAIVTSWSLPHETPAGTMHVLVTGAGGFSGSAATLALLHRGYHVIATTGSSRGRLPPDAERHGHLRIVSGNLAEAVALPERIDVILH